MDVDVNVDLNVDTWIIFKSEQSNRLENCKIQSAGNV